MDKRQQAIEFLMAIREGAFVEELYDQVKEAADLALERAKASSVVATLSFVPDSDSYHITGLVVAKLPPVKRKSQTFFPATEGLPSRKDQRQQELTFGKVRIVNDEEQVANG